MDLQSILNSSDSDEENDFKEGVSLRHQPFSNVSGDVDLEQILRDDDDDDDDEDDDYEDDEPITPWDSQQQQLSSRPRRTHNDTTTTSWNNKYNDTMISSSSATNKSFDSNNISTSHTAEDWAVLQSLLGEDNDETEADEEWLHATKGSSSHYTPYKQDVDAILMSDNEDDELEDNDTEQMSALSISLPPVPATTNDNLLNKIPMPKRRGSEGYEDEETHLDAIKADPPTTTMNNGFAGSNKKRQHNIQSTSTRDTTASSYSSRDKPTGITGTSTKSLEIEADEKAASQRAMQHAQAYERKLLKSGTRDIVSPLMVKRRLKQKIELGTRAQKQNMPASDRMSASSTQQRFGFSGVVENRTMQGISSGLKPDYLRKRGIQMDVGLPTALAVNSKFIACGTQRGIILVFDLFEVLKKVLDASRADDTWNSKQAGSITSIDLNMNDEVLVAGYTSGYIVLWDTIKGVMLRTVTETHPSPITSVRFLSDLKMVSVDAGGLVNKLTFAKTMLWSTYSMETECLLDGTAGQILAINVLPPLSTVNPQLLPEAASQLRRLVLIALSSERSSFAVAVEPSVNVLHRWARPPADRIDAVPGSSAHDMIEGQTFLPCLSWGWALISGGGNLVAPILARAWGCCVQLLLASFPTIEDEPRAHTSGNSNAGGPNSEPVHWPAFGLHGEFDVDEPVVALEWLNDRSLAYLSVTSEFTVVDTVMMTLLERLDFSGLKLVYAEFSLSRSAEKLDSNGDNTYCSTFQNSVRSSDERLLVLCQQELKFISIVGAKKRITALEEDGEWLEALAVALDHYENTVHSQEDRKRDPTGRRDLSRHPEFFSATKNEEEEWIAKLLLRYLNLAVDNAPESPLDEHGILSLDGSQAIIDLAQSHFQMLAGVCIEFCVVTRRLDLLFGTIFRRFQSVGFTSVFLDVLEPYVLNDKLSYIAPEAMTYFVDHCRLSNGIATVERCLLHMDVRIMDFDSILSLLKKNQMYSALFYVMNQGLDDFISPLEILLENLFDAADEGIALSTRRRDGVPQNIFERLGYKAIFYMQTCFEGKTFPKEEPLTQEDRLPSLRAELLNFLLRDKYVSSPHGKKKGDVAGSRTLKYPYTHVLLTVDARALLNAISIALDAADGLFLTNDSNVDSEWDVEVDPEEVRASRSQSPSMLNGTSRAPDMQQIIFMLSSVILPDERDKTSSCTTIYQSENAVNAFLDFLASYLMKGIVRVGKSITFKILTRMAERFAAAKEGANRLAEQRQILDLLTALPRNSYNTDEVLKLVDSTGIHRAALLLHQEGASWSEGNNDSERRAYHFCKAIDCYLGDGDALFRKEVFYYVKKECSGVSEPSSAMAEDNSSGESNTLRDALSARLPDLVHLDALMTAELVAELFVEDLDRVVRLMDKADSGESQFKFFQAIISGNLNEINPVAGSVLNAHLTMEHHHKYLSLMAKLHPEMVYEYLSNHDNYRPEECLKLCQDHNIADASAYLLERMGHVSSALQLILQTLESKMMSLKRTIRGMGLVDRHQPSHHYFTGRKSDNFLLSAFSGKQEKEVEAVKRLLVVAHDLCERNSRTYSTTSSEHGSQLWFNVLDRLINAKGFLRLSKEQTTHAKIMAGVLSELLRLTMQRMVSSVPLTDLVRKVTSDHSGSRLGELREMIDSLLGTYGFELRVFSGAVKVFHHDVKMMHSRQRNLKLEGSGVSRVMQFPVSKDSRQQKENTSLIFLDKTIRNSCTLRVCEGGNAAFADNSNFMEMMKSNEGGLSNAMNRLRSRRGRTTETKQLDRTRAAGLNFMTSCDQEYLADESYGESYASEPVIGQLSEAEHRGRLMTFA